MTESLGWVVAAVVGVLAILNRLVTGKRERLEGPPVPPEQVAAPHAQDAIKTAAQRNMDEVDDALEGDDGAGELAKRANRAARRRAK